MQPLRYISGLVLVLASRELAVALPGTYQLQPQDYGPAEMVRVSTAWWSWPLVAVVLLAGLALLVWAVSITIRKRRAGRPIPPARPGP